jgi:NAD(P)-dependent dehydrogenase (short-subunit alcohol dehydrogenase family)
MRALFIELQMNVMCRAMDTNYWGTVYCTKFAIPYLLKSGGSLVGVIPIGGYVGMPGRSAYSASKFAVHGFLESVSCEKRKNRVACFGNSSSFYNLQYTKGCIIGRWITKWLNSSR